MVFFCIDFHESLLWELNSKWGLDLGLWTETRFLLLTVLGDGPEVRVTNITNNPP
jgi:hypothetical protein